MLRHAFLLAWDGTDGDGISMPATEFMLSEPIQTEDGPFPPAPADHIIVGFGDPTHDLAAVDLAKAEALVTDGPATVPDVADYNVAAQNLDAIRAHYTAKMLEREMLMDAWAAELEVDGFVKVGVLHV